MHLKEGTSLQGGKYRIVRFINSGGFGCTYEAEHTVFRKRVAVKEFFMHDFCGRDEDTVTITATSADKRKLVEKLKQKFVHEAQSIFDLRHPGIIRVTDVFEENDTAYYVMDFIDGKSLKELVDQEGPLPEERALRYIRQVADALVYVHGQGLLHLDIKPGNIMIDHADNAVLIDFGASRQYEEVGKENTSTLLPYTSGYAPPEQTAMDVTLLSPAADVYALGATLYCLLTGSAPISSSLRISGDKLVPLPETTGPAVRDTVEKAMILNRHERIQTVNGFLASLQVPHTDENREGETIVHLIPGDPRPYRWLVPVLVCLIAVLCIFGSTIGSEKKEQPAPVKAATTGFINDHEYVDLGLSVKWATMNVGAGSPGDYGDYFAWGEVHPKFEYTEANSVTYGKDITGFISGNSQYDAARYHWGGSWRLPTEKELEELKDKCRWIWSKENGHSGYTVVGPNGNSIFLPSAGYRYGTSTNYVGTYGYYWSGSPYESSTQRAYYLGFGDVSRLVLWIDRYYGRSVRPVSE